MKTYTLVVKCVDGNVGMAHVSERLNAASLPGEPVLARTIPKAEEAIILVHVMEDNNRYGLMLAHWLSEAFVGPNFPSGTLLWYR